MYSVVQKSMNEYLNIFILEKWHEYKYELYSRAILFEYSSIQIFMLITAMAPMPQYNKSIFILQLFALLEDGLCTKQLIDSIQKQVLSVLWLGALAWYCLLTQNEKHDIDRVAKVGLKIIYGSTNSGFDNALLISGIRKPTLQLEKIAQQFAKKCASHNK